MTFWVLLAALAACVAGLAPTGEGNLNGGYVFSETGPHPGSHHTNERFPTAYKVIHRSKTSSIRGDLWCFVRVDVRTFRGGGSRDMAGRETVDHGMLVDNSLWPSVARKQHPCCGWVRHSVELGEMATPRCWGGNPDCHPGVRPGKGCCTPGNPGCVGLHFPSVFFSFRGLALCVFFWGRGGISVCKMHV